MLFIAGKTGLYTYDRGHSQGVCPLGMCSSSPLDWSQNIVTGTTNIPTATSLWLSYIHFFMYNRQSMATLLSRHTDSYSQQNTRLLTQIK